MSSEQRRRYFATFSALLCAASLSLGIIATTTTWWRVNTKNTDRYGLFKVCDSRVCVDGVPVEDEDFLGATRAFMIGGCFVLVANIIVLSLIAAKREDEDFSKLSCILCLVAGGFFLIASSVYTGSTRPTLFNSNLIFGYSFWLAWSATIIAILATPLAFLA